MPHSSESAATLAGSDSAPMADSMAMSLSLAAPASSRLARSALLARSCASGPRVERLTPESPAFGLARSSMSAMTVRYSWARCDSRNRPIMFTRSASHLSTVASFGPLWVSFPSRARVVNPPTRPRTSGGSTERMASNSARDCSILAYLASAPFASWISARRSRTPSNFRLAAS